MSVSFVNISSIVKDILAIAKKVKNNEIVEKVIDLQELLLNAREDNSNLKDEIKELKDKLNLLEQSTEIEENLEFSERGFCVKKNVEKRIPYCSHCWVEKHKLIPLSQQTHGGWWQYSCGGCGVDVVVLDKSGRSINEENKGEI